MAEISRIIEMKEIPDQKKEINDYKSIKPEGEISTKECQGFWDKLFNSEVKDESADDKGQKELNYKVDGASSFVDTTEVEDQEKKGGSYGELKGNGEGKYEVHHIPADSVSFIERHDGPAIKMEKADHRMTASCGNSHDAREYQSIQKELIIGGRFTEAVQMDIEDIQDKFGDKYNDALSEMIEYVNLLEMEGY